MENKKVVYNVLNVLTAHCNLEPLACLNCGSQEVIFLQSVGDAICQDCNEWQLDCINDILNKESCNVYP